MNDSHGKRKSKGGKKTRRSEGERWKETGRASEEVANRTIMKETILTGSPSFHRLIPPPPRFSPSSAFIVRLQLFERLEQANLKLDNQRLLQFFACNVQGVISLLQKQKKLLQKLLRAHISFVKKLSVRSVFFSN